MKTPAPPPRVDHLLAATSADLTVMERLMTYRPVPDYPHWDILRYKQPPDGLTHEQWWLAEKLHRNANRRELELVDTHGVPFGYCLPDIVLELCDEIAKRAGGQIAMADVVTNPATRDRYVISSLIEEAITSSQLEGASTTRADAKRMLRSGRPPGDRSERMIVNNFAAMRRVGGIADRELTPDLVCSLHEIVTDGTLDDPAGAGRLQADGDDRVAVYGDGEQILHRPPPATQLPQRLERLCSFANDSAGSPWMPPVLRALTLHFMCGYDHYFEDGNGRTARALFYWGMLHEGYWLTEFLTISTILRNAPSQYVRSFMMTEQDDGDLTYFFIYHLKVIVRAIDELEKYLERKVNELRSVRVALAATPGEYNHRQVALLEAAVKDPSVEFSTTSHALSHGVSAETARHDLVVLERRGLVAKSKRGRKFVWSAAPDLTRRLRDANSK